ncbi:MAG: hypothetical protein CVU71_14040 [Deltaproteobacteria bacterium HGW-Deltaproteobacteria-6]|jgi:hypothetical protein|nr:MAG: hypothetical protein CVU71_14040 [Deltaproteobacteria bacterium HGW-Deltaproteobacteria-6]
MNGNAFILFLKYPERGAVKTRLARTLGDDVAYELYACFLSDIAAMTHQVNAETIIVYAGPAGIMFPDFPGVRLMQQRGSGIGCRMYFALEDVFALGFERCVLVGSDIPDLPARLVNDALNKLEVVDVVLGPSRDGGYYLVGCNRASLCRPMFSGIPWSTSGVLSETLRRIAEAGLVTAQVEEWWDIDEPDDLRQFYARNSDAAGASKVMKFLEAKGIINR